MKLFKFFVLRMKNINCLLSVLKKIGTEAWIDASGYLRQKDYIADKDGYRILKSKTIFVGKSRPIKVSLK